MKETPMHRRHGPLGNFDFSLSLLTERLGYSASKWRRYIWEEIYLFISYLPSSSGYDVMLFSNHMKWIMYFAMKFTQDIWQIRTLHGNGVTWDVYIK